ncbi:MAG: glycosyltransferase [Acidimicrobiia bacterium]|jgi:glycosyltransferase involved in cell wall biosynthesis
MTTARHVRVDRRIEAPTRWADIMPTVSLIIPTINEERNVANVLARIPDWVHEVILVDGLSTDRTVPLARALRPDVKVVMESNPGKGSALIAGFAAATGDIIAAIDADGSMDPAELHSFIGQLVSGADYVKGSRFVQGGGTVDMEWHRRLGNWGLMMAAKMLFGGNYSDLCYGYFAFWRDALPLLDPDVPGFEIETQINVRALRANLKIAEVPSFEERRLHGVSNLHAWRDGLRILRTIIRERFSRRKLPPVIDLR